MTKYRTLFTFTMTILLGLVLAACASSPNYDDFRHIRHWDEFDDIVAQEDGDLFFLYIYLEGCPACREVKDDVFDFATENKGNHSVYFVDGADIAGTAPFETGRYVPALIAVRDGEKADLETGVSGIRSIIDAVEDGSYTHDYADFEHIRDWDEFDDIADSEDRGYLLYFYLENCPACREVQDEVFDYAARSDGHYNVYFVDGADIEGTPSFETGQYVPAFFVFSDDEILDHQTGVSGVRNVLDTVTEYDSP